MQGSLSLSRIAFAYHHQVSVGQVSASAAIARGSFLVYLPKTTMGAVSKFPALSYLAGTDAHRGLDVALMMARELRPTAEPFR